MAVFLYIIYIILKTLFDIIVAGANQFFYSITLWSGFPDNIIGFDIWDDHKSRSFSDPREVTKFLWQDIVFKFTKDFDHVLNPLWDAYHIPSLITRNSKIEKLHSIRIPLNYIEVFLGFLPHCTPFNVVNFIDRKMGFYNFYLVAFRDIVFFPDFVSEYLQMHFHIENDFTMISDVREIMFMMGYFYRTVLILRGSMGLWLLFNPYRWPQRALVILSDWIEAFWHRIVSRGKDIGIVELPNLFVTLVIGWYMDFLNNLVFTFPYLPSEAKRAVLNYEYNKDVKDTVDTLLHTPIYLFSGLPSLWYKYGVPNEIRKFWYFDRPEILNYMRKAYSDIDLRILPDGIEEFLPEKKLNPFLRLFSKTSHMFTEDSSSLHNLFQPISNHINLHHIVNNFDHVLK